MLSPIQTTSLPPIPTNCGPRRLPSCCRPGVQKAPSIHVIPSAATVLATGGCRRLDGLICGDRYERMVILRPPWRAPGQCAVHTRRTASKDAWAGDAVMHAQQEALCEFGMRARTAPTTTAEHSRLAHFLAVQTINDCAIWRVYTSRLALETFGDCRRKRNSGDRNSRCLSPSQRRAAKCRCGPASVT